MCSIPRMCGGGEAKVGRTSGLVETRRLHRSGQLPTCHSCEAPITSRQAGELAIRQWIQRNPTQVSLETWTEARGSVAPVNRTLINIQLAIVKAELKDIMDVFPSISPEYRLETLHKLQKLIPTAQALVEETGDKGLREIVTAISAQVAGTGEAGS